MWYEVLQSDLIPINYMKRGERISIVQKNKIEDPEIYIHYYEASLPERWYLGCVFCSLMYHYVEGRAEASCGIICNISSHLIVNASLLLNNQIRSYITDQSKLLSYKATTHF